MWALAAESTKAPGKGFAARTHIDVFFFTSAAAV
jgi:hypothetical protein